MAWVSTRNIKLIAMKSPFATDSRLSTKVTRVADERETRRSRIRFTAMRGLMLASAATLGTIAGTGIGLTNEVVTAAECDCWEESCETCGTPDSAMKNCLIYKSLDALAGGIEKVLGLDKSSRCDEFGCDDACDAASMHELMLPMAPMQIESAAPTHVHPPARTHVSPAPMYGDSTPYIPTPHYVPERQYAPSVPSPVPNEVEIPSAMPPAGSETIEVMPPTHEAIPQPTPESQPNKDGSLFDALDDPFRDDEARTYRPYRNVRPSGYLQRAGSATSQQRRGSIAVPHPGTPARKATHRTPTPSLNAPVRQTSGTGYEPIGSGVTRTSATSPTTSPTSYQPATKSKRQSNSSTQANSAAITELTPTGYLSSTRSARINR